MLTADEILKKLSRSDIYCDYERAFTDATELPLTLRAKEGWGLFLHGNPRENPFCALLADASKTCSQCLQNQAAICDPAKPGATTKQCFAGLYDTAVPIRVGKDVVGYLQTGQIALEKPKKAKLEKVTKLLVDWGSTVDLTKLQETYFHSRVLSEKQYAAMVHLLEIFAKHLSEIAGQLIVQDEEKEAPMVRKARSYIGEHHAEDLSLTELAKALHVSTFYFCKMFKQSTGLTFTDYLGRVRIEKAKALLLHGDLRVSEIAFEVGFQSLTHFNRLFRKLVGQSPSDYRQTAHRL